MAPPSPSLHTSRTLDDAKGLNGTDLIPSSIHLKEKSLIINGRHPILTEVPENITITPSPFSSSDKTNKIMNNFSSTSAGCFIGFHVDESRNRHVAPLGKLRGIKFTSIFRFKQWWCTHWTGNNGNDVETETQIMILDKNDAVERPYVVFLPLIEGSFATSLQAGVVDDYVDVCVESGSTQVLGSTFKCCLYIHVGDDPYGVVKEAMKVARMHLGTFKLLEEKTPPEIVDKFGWCTWDAFYRKVDAKGVMEGVNALVKGGCPPGMVIIDDGWQSICIDDDPIDREGIDGAAIDDAIPLRLVKFEENYKFKDYESTKFPNTKGMGAFIKDLKEEFKTVQHVYVWEALCGYWAGIRPNVLGMLEAQVIESNKSPSFQMFMDDFATTCVSKDGVGLVSPELAYKMYDGLHSHLALSGIDGVKIDEIQVLETLGEEFGGRIELAKAYYKALTDSVWKHFKGNGVMASMEQCNDFFFLGTEAIALGRAGDDFWCAGNPYVDPDDTFWLQGCHLVHCAYNSLWLGNFVQPDWDMFQSTQKSAEFHGAARAISGGLVYVSDPVGQHNFELLEKLVLPDGSILRCKSYALPTRDCLFEDPLKDGKTMLKIWNLNKYTGVLGVFNCQGGGWFPEHRRTKSASECSSMVRCFASPEDIEWRHGKDSISIQNVDTYVVYMHQKRETKLIKFREKLEISKDPFNYEVLTVSPVIVLPGKCIQFAPIGLVNMFNSGGAVESMDFDGESGNWVKIGVKGRGEMSVFASQKTVSCKIDGSDVEFGYEDQIVTIQIPCPDSSRLSVVEYLF